MAKGRARNGRVGLRWPQDLSAVAALAALAALMLLALGGFILSYNLSRLGEERRAVDRAVAILEQAQEVVADMLDAETGQRGYLLTGEERYLEPYEASVQRIWKHFAQLDRLVQRPDQRRRLDALRPLIEAKLDELDRTIVLHQRSSGAALALVRTDEGLRLMEGIRAILTAFESTGQQVLRERSRQRDRRTQASTMLAVACGALALLAAGISALGVLRRRDNRRLEEQNARLEREVEERTATLEEANAELEAFAATISHDLRAPARAIGGYAEALEEDAGPRLAPVERGYLARIAGAAERMDGLIDDILGYSRLARQDLPLGRVELEQVVEAVLDQLREEAAGARIALRGPLPAVRGHAGALHLAVTNLLGNALKFTAPGQAPEVTIRAEPAEEGLVRLWVEDRGIGIAPADQDRIFRPFERLHGREAYPGSGVGLAIVRRVAERLGGACGVVPAPGQGSRFWLDLPEWPEA
ncbi:CHASE3 domain-containing protein [Belnapia sp. T6]|uniref:histidine kinase n=1 Tax=Belnapia mucosa TaxID=2804532 RepID=A0ABS1V7E9_9PROT|nr:sensor histidine kinase [Belnapia mucosa]MBL6456248.1 CHASE3 domain-containing protein [Belnapia mucosa]